MIKLKKICAILLCMSMIFGLTACSGEKTQTSTPAASAPETSTPAPSAQVEEGIPADGPTFELSLAYQSAENTTQHTAAQYFKKQLEEKSNGKITLTLYPAGQMGSDREIAESVQFGDISIISSANSPLLSFIPEVGVFDAPMIFAGYDPVKIQEVFREGEFRNTMNEAFNKSGYELISLSANEQYREMSSNKPVSAMSDFNGIRIRTMDNKYHMAFWKAVGASPTPLAFSELYLSLQQGLIDAQENPYEVLVYTGIHEQQKYIINTDHCLFVSMFSMNKDLYDSMPDNYKKVLAEVVTDYEDYNNNLTNESIATTLEKLVNEFGLEVIDLDESVLNEMKEKAQPVYDMVNSDIGSEWIDMLKKELDAK